MDEKCNNCEEKQACIPYFAHEAALYHYNHANRRMLIALVTVCITFIVPIIVFVTGYTAREKNWLDTLAGINHTTAITEVAADGVYQQPNP